MYQSHKGWTSNLLQRTNTVSSDAYQSHKGWTSNDIGFQNSANHAFVSIPQGVDVKLRREGRTENTERVSIPQGVDVKPFLELCCLLSYLCINPTRGGRQTLGIQTTAAGMQLYQSHKGWTSNLQLLTM